MPTDNFNRASLGTNWTANNGAWSIQGSVDLQETSAAAAAYLLRRSLEAYPSAQYSQGKIVNTNASTDRGMGVGVRISTAGAVTGYFANFLGTAAGPRINKVIAGTVTNLAAGSVTRALNDVVRLEVRGSVLQAYVNGILRATVDDPSVAAGAPGFANELQSAAANLERYDDWEGGSLMVGPVLTADFGYPNTSLDAATTLGAGASFACGQRGNIALKQFAWDVIRAGTVTALQVDLEGTLNGIDWLQVDSYNTPSADTLRFVVDKPLRALRANIINLVGGGNITTRIWAT